MQAVLVVVTLASVLAMASGAAQCYTPSSIASCSSALRPVNMTTMSGPGLLDTLMACLNNQGKQNTTVKILIPKLPTIMATVGKRAKQYQEKTGIQVILEPVTFYYTTKEILDDLGSGGKRDGWIFSPEGVGLIASADGLADLGPFMEQNPQLGYGQIGFWTDIGNVYAKKTVAIPWDVDVPLLYYRADLFERYNLTVPDTWDDFLDIARAMNGTDTDGDGQPDLFGACFDVAPSCKAHLLLPSIAGPYIQYKGTSQGFWLDPDTIPNLRPLMNNPGMAAALTLVKDLLPYTNPKKTCSLFSGGANVDFQAGRCLMTVNNGDEFKAVRMSTVLRPDQVGVAVVPGSSKVLVREQNVLTTCTLALCPNRLQIGQITSKGDKDYAVMVNRAPYQPPGWMTGVSNKRPPEQQQAAFDFLAFLSSSEVAWEDVLDPSHPAEPYKQDHLSDLERWKGAGYDARLTQSYLSAIQTTYSVPNVVLDTRLAYDVIGYGYRAPFETAVINITKPNAPSDAIDKAMLAMEVYSNYMMRLAIPRFGPAGLVDMAQQYWDILGRVGSVKGLLAARRPENKQLFIQEVDRRPDFIPAVGAPVITVSVLALVAVTMYVMQRRKHLHRSLLGKVLAPGVGPNTTLVITDVQDSTQLFELLPVHCMDKCMQQTCRTIRALLYKHNGYESATEGDSFLIAFHSANDALDFCIRLQDALLHIEWSHELLQNEGCDSVHPVWVTSNELSTKCEQMLQGVWKQTSTSAKPALTWRTPFLWCAWPFQCNPPSASGDTASQPDSETFYQLCDSNTFESMNGSSGRRSRSPSRGKAGSVGGAGCDASDQPTTPSQQIATLTDVYEDDRGSNASTNPLDTQTSHTQAHASPCSMFNGDLSMSNLNSSGSLKPRSNQALRFTQPPVSETLIVRELIGQAWQKAAHETNGSRANQSLVFQGLRVRCAVNSGLDSDADTSFNKAAGRMQYSGSFLAATKMIEACTLGGQILLSQSTFMILDVARLSGEVLLLHLGEHLVNLGAAATATDLNPTPVVATDVEVGQATASVAAKDGIHLYTALHSKLAPRLALLGCPKTKDALAFGVLDAPLGTVTIGFINMAGLPSIKAWDAAEAHEAVKIFSEIMKERLIFFGGYMVEHVDGFALVCFSSSLAALRFGIDVRDAMLKAPWSSSLLKFGLAEEVAVMQTDHRGQSQRTVLLRGPRFKAGFDIGSTKSQVHVTTGRMAYRGKVMNRAARIQQMAASGQVLCSMECWGSAMDIACCPRASTRGGGLDCNHAAAVQLKGIKDKMHIYQVHADVSNRRYSVVIAAGETLRML